MASLLNRAKIIQNAYIVNDIKATCEKWNAIYGVGPFIVIEHFPLIEVRHDGQVVDLDMSVAFVQSGDLNIELIQQHNDGPSAFRDMYPAGQEGFHHVALICDDYDAEVAKFEAAGYPLKMRFQTGPDTSLSYVDTRPAFGHMLELYQDGPGLHALYGLIRESAENWDGKDMYIYPDLG